MTHNDSGTQSPLYPPRVVSGIQPTTNFHLGHYFGAVQQHLRLHHEYPGESFFIIADYHALTRSYEREVLRDSVRNLASSYLALGLETNKAVLYKQSDVPQLTELFWMLSCFSPLSDLLRIPTFKHAVEQGVTRTAALATYPVLMAADTLSLRATTVPVGHDQLPSLERVRDIARAFNSRLKIDIFPLPIARVGGTPVVKGIDGRKMSAWYGNTINPFDDFYALRRRVFAIRTDSRGQHESKDPQTCTVFHLYSLVAEPSEVDEMRNRYEKGQIDYGEAKRKLVQAIQEHFAEAFERFRALQRTPDFVEDVLREGFSQAADEVQVTTEAVRQLLGLS